MEEQISKELDRLEAERVIEKVNYSEWASTSSKTGWMS